jgi:hypothetical protein
MMILGFASVGVMGYRRRNKTAMLRVAASHGPDQCYTEAAFGRSFCFQFQI